MLRCRTKFDFEFKYYITTVPKSTPVKIRLCINRDKRSLIIDRYMIEGETVDQLRSTCHKHSISAVHLSRACFQRLLECREQVET